MIPPHDISNKASSEGVAAYTAVHGSKGSDHERGYTAFLTQLLKKPVE